MKKKLLWVISITLVVLLLFFGTGLGAYAISMFQKTLAGMGQMTFTDEVIITDVRINSLSKVTVTAESNANTVADRVYKVQLYLDDISTANQTTSWTVDKIPGVKNKVVFSGLNLNVTTLVEAEVTY